MNPYSHTLIHKVHAARRKDEGRRASHHVVRDEAGMVFHRVNLPVYPHIVCGGRTEKKLINGQNSKGPVVAGKDRVMFLFSKEGVSLE